MTNVAPERAVRMAAFIAFGPESQEEEDDKLHLLEQAVASAPMGISISRYQPGGDCPMIYVNAAFEKLTGYRAEELIGRDCRLLQGKDRDQEARAQMRQAIRSGVSAQVLLRNYRKDGSRFMNEVHLSHVYDSAGQLTHLVGIALDVTAHMEAKARLARQAEHDALTGLANRYLLVAGLERAVNVAAATSTPVAVAIMDLDNFKHMNDRFGHIESDRLLIQVAGRLASLVKAPDLVARLGGDEFALVLTEWDDQARLQKQIDRILQEIRRPLRVGGQEVMMTGSVGLAIHGQDGHEPEALLQKADVAMYWVKRRGKNSSRFYTPELRLKHNEPLDVALGFRRALKDREFRLWYQPRVDARTREVVGYEALLRWQHPDRGLLMPSQFVRIAEDTGLINDIGRWVLEEALQQNAAWRKAGLRPVQMSVNVSPAQMVDPTFPAMVAATLARSGLPPESLELELTESLLIEHADVANGRVATLKQLGLRIAIDDFGTGYSGLQYLTRFPIDTIKIDHFFTEHIEHDRTAATICRSMVQLGESLGLNVVAEGVESEAQAHMLQGWNCNEMQGYLFATPLPPNQAQRVLEEQLTSRTA